MIRAVVFDLDGTLVDSRGDIVAAVEHALGAHGIAAPSPAEIASYIGDGAAPLLARSAKLTESDPALGSLLDTFLEFYLAHVADHTTLMPGARGCLDELAALPLAICTNKPRRTTLALLALLGVAERFAVVMAGGDLPTKKPAPEPLLAIATHLGIEPSELVMVGDGPQDVECGRRAGAYTVGVEGGILPRERLLAAQPDLLVPSLAALPEAIEKLASATSR